MKMTHSVDIKFSFDINSVVEFYNQFIVNNPILQRDTITDAMVVGHFICEISEQSDLDKIVEQLKERGFLEKLDDTSIQKTSDAKLDIRYRAHIIGLFLIGEQISILNDSLNDACPGNIEISFDKKLPPLVIELEGTIITHNMPELIDFFKRKSIVLYKTIADEKPIIERQHRIKSLISTLNEIDYVMGKTSFEKDIKFLSNSLVQSSRQVEKTPTGSEHIFTAEGYRLFMHIMENYVQPFNDGLAADASYYFQKMKKDKYAHSTQADFSDWFFEKYDVSVTKFRPVAKLENVASRKRDYQSAVYWLKNS